MTCERAPLIAAATCALVACAPDATDPPWSLAHDRVVAVRAEPPHIAPGEIALLEGLFVHAGEPLATAPPTVATAPDAPGGLFTAVHYYIDHWRIDGPDEAALAVARTELGLPAGAPVPLDVVLQLPGPLYAQKTVWLGDSRDNPAPPTVALPPVLAVGRGYPLDVTVEPGVTVRWLTSCGTLERDTTPHATLTVEQPCEGELVVVVRDAAGGTSWQILSLRAT